MYIKIRPNNSLFLTTNNNKENIQGVPGGMDKTSGECSLG